MRRLTTLPVLALLLAACSGSSPATTAVVPIGRGSDLTVAAVTFDPEAPRVGDEVIATVQWVDLAGDEPFPVPITIDLMLQPDALGLVCSWETVEALGTVSCSFPGWTDPGVYRWDAWVDTLKVIEEPNEGNNTLGGTISVEP
ncbi:MAG: hypothetical protein JW785_07180 [Acidimicrobiia bacterium]|nr:hypothetical protein [Acidimicrobiia bacterium]